MRASCLSSSGRPWMAVLAQSHLALDPISSYCQVFVFPNSNDLPARSLQCEVGLLIALDVLGELLDPSLPVGLGHRSMGRARMPETTVDKHGNSLAGEGDVDPAPGGIDTMVDPVAQAALP